jgi:murein DD-endopeptidase MepM/ murein hydrolase activator NlpD
LISVLSGCARDLELAPSSELPAVIEEKPCLVYHEPIIKRGGILKVQTSCAKTAWIQFENKIVLPFESKDHFQTALFGVSMEHDLGKYPVLVLDQGKKVLAQSVFQIQDNDYPSEVLTVDKKRVSPTSAVVLKRIARESKLIFAAYQEETPSQLWKNPFVWPIQSAVTSHFGNKRTYNGKMKSYHTGIDLKAASGTPIYPSESGKVSLAQDLFYTGNTVIVNHGYGIITLYAHLSQIKVKKEDPVDRQTLLGLSGQTGRVTGPHLHWQIVIHSVKVSPLEFLRLLGSNEG